MFNSRGISVYPRYAGKKVSAGAAICCSQRWENFDNCRLNCNDNPTCIAGCNSTLEHCFAISIPGRAAEKPASDASLHYLCGLCAFFLEKFLQNRLTTETQSPQRQRRENLSSEDQITFSAAC
jgi:hypothetical protein